MRRVRLGRTGLSASVLGLGAGGHSRLGLFGQEGESAAQRVVHAALDHGVNFIDTAEAYGTEEVIGKALVGVARERVILSSKKTTFGAERVGPGDVERALEASLRRLRTDHLDIYHLHGVRPHAYARLRDDLLPTLERLQRQGKIRFLGITEAFADDPGHAMLTQALADDHWDVVMVGFNILNQSARSRVFPHTLARDVGTLIMFAVRRAFSQPERLRELLDELAQRERISPETAQVGLDFVVHDAGANSLPDAAYRFCRDEPGAHVVLSGTGDLAHLADNVRSIVQPALPVPDSTRLQELFHGVSEVSGQ
jgi:aryl-alcohol dehydrogenase-like predicted oxidoreductase